MRPPTLDRPTAIRWRICALMIVVSFVAYLLRTNMSVAGVPMSADLGLSHVQLGVVLAAFAWGYAIFQFPGGLLGDVIGARRALTILVGALGRAQPARRRSFPAPPPAPRPRWCWR